MVVIVEIVVIGVMIEVIEISNNMRIIGVFV
jgi:hypothetical protein